MYQNLLTLIQTLTKELVEIRESNKKELLRCPPNYMIETGNAAITRLEEKLINSRELPDEIQLLCKMKDMGGHFASNLAEAWLRADSSNRRMLRENFNDLLKTYRSSPPN